MEDPIETIAEFERPPVVEVVLGIQFSEDVVDLEVLAEFAVSVKEAFPKREQLDPLPRVAESFQRPPEGPRVEFRLGNPPLPRTWFLSEDNRLLLQLQADRLILNWRRVELEDPYPRYKVLRPKFDEMRDRLLDVLKHLGREPSLVDHVEVSYINELSQPAVRDDAHPPLSRLLTTVADPDVSGFLPEPEDAGYQARFRIQSPDPEEGFAGRLVISTEPAYRAIDQQPIYLLKLSANLVGSFQTEEAIVRMLDLGRQWVVKGFVQVVTADTQAAWGPKI